MKLQPVLKFIPLVYRLMMVACINARGCDSNRQDASAQTTTSSSHTAIAPGATVTILLLLIFAVSIHLGIALLPPKNLSSEAGFIFYSVPFPSTAFILTTSLILLSSQPWRGLSRMQGHPHSWSCLKSPC